MSTIHQLHIRHFRGIETFDQVFNTTFTCLIGRGDSGKSTLLEAISLVLSPSWTHPFFDNDFYHSDISNPIVIEATLRNVPALLLTEQKFGMYLRGLDKATGHIVDDLEEEHEPVLTVRLQVEKDLEPIWQVVANRTQTPKPISASDRARLNVFFVADYIDRHFTWSKGGPLYALLRQESDLAEQDDSIMIDVLRDAKVKIDDGPFTRFDAVIAKVTAKAARLGIDISKTINTIDFKDIVIKDGKISLHEDAVPFRLKGKGSKRLISMAIQATIAANGGIMLIDEIEQGLEPDRVQHLVSTLKANNNGQIFITTHSRDVLVELTTADIFRFPKNSQTLVPFPASLQNVLRANPEGFFAHKVIVAEGLTEMGFCRALNKYRMIQGKKNMAYLGVRIVHGAGKQMLEYCKGFHSSGFSLCLFCDSDDAVSNAAKPGLGVPVFDWDAGECTEVAVVKDVPFDAVKTIFELATHLRMEEQGCTATEARKQLWQTVSHLYGKGCPADIESATDEIAIRRAIGLAAHKNGWFKNQAKGFALADIVFSNYEYIDNNSTLKKSLTALSNWIEDNGPQNIHGAR